MNPGRIVCYALGTVWMLGAIMQLEIMREGLSYPHGEIFVGLMLIGSIVLYLMPTLLEK